MPRSCGSFPAGLLRFALLAPGSARWPAIGRTLPLGWVSLNQWLDTATGDSYWSQYTNVPVQAAGTTITVGDPAPIGDRWNLAAVELTGGD